MDNNCEFNIDEMINAMREYAPSQKPKNHMSSSPSGGPLSLGTLGIIALALLVVGSVVSFFTFAGSAIIAFFIHFFG